MSGPLTHRRISPWVWACLGFFLLSRAPIIWCPNELNVDESQMAAQAMRYAHDLTPWRSVEGESNGPLDSWLLLAVHDLGLPYGYRTLHGTAALLLAAILLLTYHAGRRLAGDAAALIGLAAGCWWLAWAPVQDFEHYASELGPCLLLSGAVALLVSATREPGRLSVRRAFGAGLLLGLMPWGKLQAAPVALALGGWALVDAFAFTSVRLPGRGRYAAALLAGAIGPSVLLLGWVIRAGAGEEMWRAYVIAGLAHTAPRTWLEHLRYIRDLAFLQPASPWFCGTALLAVSALWLHRKADGAVAGRTLGLVAVLLLAGAYATLRPITQWAHYALFCLGALVLGSSVAARSLLAARQRLRRRAGAAVLVIGLVPLPVAYFVRDNDLRDYLRTWHYESSHSFDGQAFLAHAVRYYAPQTKSLAVWGWKPSLYVDLGVAPAVRNAGFVYLHDGNPAQEFLREGFMRDLQQSAPDTIVDVEDYIWRGQRRTGPETFPALARLLAEHYRPAGQGRAEYTADYSLIINVYVRER